MKDECMISIIIPVYNVETFLPECLESILKMQEYRDYELILVDDGSTDGSPNLCDMVAERDQRVKVIHQENCGAAVARNTGLREASGKYILFIDSDDYIASNSLDKIMDQLKADDECDIVFLNAVSVFPDGSVKPHEKYKKEDYYSRKYNDILDDSYSRFPDFVWGKLIDRKMIEKYDIYFAEGIICEDMDYTMKLFLHAKTYNVVDCDFYYYREGREGSVMNTKSDKLFTAVFDIISKWVKLAETSYKQYSKELYSRLSLYYFWILLPRYGMLSKEDKKRYKYKVDELKWLLKYPKDKKVRIMKSCYHVLGLNAVSGFMKLYYQLMNALRNKR